MKAIEGIVLASIAAFVPSCPMASGCDPPDRAFTHEATLTVAELASVIRPTDDGRQPLVDCHAVCRHAYSRDTHWQPTRVDTCADDLVDRGGRVPTEIAGTVRCSGHAVEYLCEGRRPVEHVELGSTGEGLARHLSECAYLEAAAVIAFDELIEALSTAAAPATLIDRCRRARDDEAAHARDVGHLAIRRGAIVTAPACSARPPTMLALALANATEGCVHEAWAALRAAWIGAHATDAELRALYARIAIDEVRHAQLAWDLHAWWLATLDAGEAATLRVALAEALAELPAVAAAQASLMPAALGLPDAATSSAIARDFGGRLAA